MIARGKDLLKLMMRLTMMMASCISETLTFSAESMIQQSKSRLRMVAWIRMITDGNGGNCLLGAFSRGGSRGDGVIKGLFYRLFYFLTHFETSQPIIGAFRRLLLLWFSSAGTISPAIDAINDCLRSIRC